MSIDQMRTKPRCLSGLEFKYSLTQQVQSHEESMMQSWTKLSMHIEEDTVHAVSHWMKMHNSENQFNAGSMWYKSHRSWYYARNRDTMHVVEGDVN